jgi:hypothetical protein
VRFSLSEIALSSFSPNCDFPASQQTILTNYIQKFLIGGGTGNTASMYSDGFSTFDKSTWIDWTAPALS